MGAQVRLFLCLFVFIFFFLNLIPAQAQSSLGEEFTALKEQFRDMQEQMKSMDEKIQQQQVVIDKYENANQSAENRIQGLEDQVAQGAEKSPNRSLLGKWNPEIGVVADTVLKLDSGKTDMEGSDRLSLRELELVFGSPVDPYSRFDATVSFSEIEEPSLEEGYLTHFGLPVGITARIGKFKPKVGKAIPVHRDSLETIDEPLVIQRYFGAEGFNKSGLDFTKTVELPWAVTHQISVGVLSGGNGEDGTAFGDVERRPTVYSHLKNYLDLTDETGLEVGFSHMAGSRDEDSHFEVQVLGADTTLTHHLNANQSIKLQSEIFNLNRKETVDLDGNIWGWYGLADFRFHPLWSTGIRFDLVQIVDNDPANPNNEDKAVSGYLTFYQSEFVRWRGQFTRTEFNTGVEDNTFMIQGTFAIGEHKHKLQ